LQLLREPSSECRRQSLRLVKLDQMPRTLDDSELRPGNEFALGMPTVDGNPGVLASPNDEDG